MSRLATVSTGWKIILRAGGTDERSKREEMSGDGQLCDPGGSGSHDTGGMRVC